MAYKTRDPITGRITTHYFTPPGESLLNNEKEQQAAIKRNIAAYLANKELAAKKLKESEFTPFLQELQNLERKAIANTRSPIAVNGNSIYSTSPRNLDAEIEAVVAAQRNIENLKSWKRLWLNPETRTFAEEIASSLSGSSPLSREKQKREAEQRLQEFAFELERKRIEKEQEEKFKRSIDPYNEVSEWIDEGLRYNPEKNQFEIPKRDPSGLGFGELLALSPAQRDMYAKYGPQILTDKGLDVTSPEYGLHKLLPEFMQLDAEINQAVELNKKRLDPSRQINFDEGLKLIEQRIGRPLTPGQKLIATKYLMESVAKMRPKWDTSMEAFMGTQNANWLLGLLPERKNIAPAPKSSNTLFDPAYMTSIYDYGLRPKNP